MLSAERSPALGPSLPCRTYPCSFRLVSPPAPLPAECSAVHCAVRRLLLPSSQPTGYQVLDLVHYWLERSASLRSTILATRVWHAGAARGAYARARRYRPAPTVYAVQYMIVYSVHVVLDLP